LTFKTGSIGTLKAIFFDSKTTYAFDFFDGRREVDVARGRREVGNVLVFIVVGDISIAGHQAFKRSVKPEIFQ